MGKKCAVGGTFSHFHAGHKKLLLGAIGQGKLIVGITSGAFAAKLGKKYAQPFGKRKRELEKFLQKNSAGEFEIVEIGEFAGPAARDGGITHLAYGEDKEGQARKVNALRAKNKLAPLKLVPIPHAYGQDLKKISSSAIAGGKIWKNGKRAAPIVVAVGSKNRTKLQGAKEALRMVFPKTKCRVVACETHSGVASQPFGQQTIKGAINRAKGAYLKTAGADYGVGLESGLFEFGGKLFDVAFCALFDGRECTLGNSMGFALPAQIEKEARGGKEDMGSIVSRISGIENVGSSKGAIHFLSAGMLHRKEMNAQALACAFIPRIAKKNGIC